MDQSLRVESSYNEDSGKLKQKLIQNPLLTLGLISLTGIVGYGGYMITQNKGKPLSLQLIYLRLAAQGSFVGFLTIGVLYSFGKQHLGLFSGKKNQEN